MIFIKRFLIIVISSWLVTLISCSDKKKESAGRELSFFRFIRTFPVVPAADAKMSPVTYIADTITIGFSTDVIAYLFPGTLDMYTGKEFEGSNSFLFKENGREKAFFMPLIDTAFSQLVNADSLLKSKNAIPPSVRLPNESAYIKLPERNNSDGNRVLDYVLRSDSFCQDFDTIRYYLSDRLKLPLTFSRSIDSSFHAKLFQVDLIRRQKLACNPVAEQPYSIASFKFVIMNTADTAINGLIRRNKSGWE